MTEEKETLSTLCLYQNIIKDIRETETLLLHKYSINKEYWSLVAAREILEERFDEFMESLSEKRD